MSAGNLSYGVIEDSVGRLAHCPGKLAVAFILFITFKGAGQVCAYQTMGVQAYGCNVYLKHCFLNGR